MINPCRLTSAWNTKYNIRCAFRKLYCSSPSTRQPIRCLSSVDTTKLRPKQQQQLSEYVDRLLKQNKVMNLTAIQTAEEAWDRHVMDSLSLLPAIDACSPGNAEPLRLVDVGSGAGLPGLILGIIRPHWQVVLLDSIQKRCNFVEDVVRHLGLSNIDVLWSRAESAGRDKQLREGFDVALARAVAEMRTLVELSLPLVKVNGHLIAAKGPSPEEEVRLAHKAISALGGSLSEIIPVASFGPLGQRTAVVVRKTKRTPVAYPRDNGLPKKRPL